MTTNKSDLDDTVEIKMSSEEAAAAVDLLSFSVGAFEIMAQTAYKSNDTKGLEALQIRIAFARLFAEKLLQGLEIGDTTNKTFH